MDPITLTPDTTAATILENVRQTLLALRVADAPVFASVVVTDDLETFRNTGDALKGASAAVYGATPAEGPPTDNSALRTYRMPITIGVRFMTMRAAGQSEQVAITEMHRLTDLIRQALRRDRSRGGYATLVEWGGKYLDGTEIEGQPVMDVRKPNQAFYTFSVPAAVGWEVSA